MTESDWDQSRDLRTLLAAGEWQNWSKRKLRLFATACCRRIWRLIPNRACRQLVDVTEKYADNLAFQDELTAAMEIARHDIRQLNLQPSGPLQAAHAAVHAAAEVKWFGSRATWWAAMSASRSAAEAKAKTLPWSVERTKQALLVHDIFGNPFRPVAINSAWLHWNDGTVVKIAQSIYDARRFADLPILGDALEDAGCTDAAILEHCRSGGEHVRGCWVVDLLLGKS